MVIVRLFASFRDAVGQKSIEIDANTVEELIEKLIAKYNMISSMLVESTEPLKLKPYNMILINGRGVWLLNGLSTKLNADDVVSIFPPTGGG
jgi:molybdopterin synthase sulfur carrier subunit